jgi:uncharacterized membrane protein
MSRSEVVPLNMSVDAALKYIVSMGVVAPPAGPLLNAVDAAAQVVAAQAQLSEVKSGSQTAPTQTALSSEGVTTPVTPSRSSD